MPWLLRFAVLNVFRNTRRSLLTVGTVLLGTALATVGLSWINGVFSSMLDNVAAVVGEVRVVTPAYEAREALAPIYENIPDSAPVVDAIRGAGLRAYPLITTGVTATVGEEIGDTFCLMLGAEEDYYREVLHLDEQLLDGAFLSGEGGEALLGRVLAQDLGARVGQEVVLLGQTQDGSISPIKATVVGVVDAGDGLSNRRAFVGLEQARYLTDIPDGAIEISVQGGGVRQAHLTAERLRALPALDGLMVQAWNDRVPYNLVGNVAQVIFSVLGATIVFITALGVLNTMMMSVLERTSEVGVLRAMGMDPAGVVFMFLVEAMVIGLSGGLAGAGLGYLPAHRLEVHGIRLGDQVAGQVGVPLEAVFYADVTSNILIGAVLLGVLTAVLGALIPALRAAGIQPVDAMRSKR